MDWQPIETAPREGSVRVHIYREGYYEDQAICWWSEARQSYQAVNGVEFPGATHWQPVPEPPK